MFLARGDGARLLKRGVRELCSQLGTARLREVQWLTRVTQPGGGGFMSVCLSPQWLTSCSQLPDQGDLQLRTPGGAYSPISELWAPGGRQPAANTCWHLGGDSSPLVYACSSPPKSEGSAHTPRSGSLVLVPSSRQAPCSVGGGEGRRGGAYCLCPSLPSGVHTQGLGEPPAASPTVSSHTLGSRQP